MPIFYLFPHFYVKVIYNEKNFLCIVKKTAPLAVPGLKVPCRQAYKVF